MPVLVARARFTDFEALQDIVQDKRSEVVQLGRGRMHGSTTHLSFGEQFGISTGWFTHALRARGVLSDHRWCLGMLLAGQGPAVGHGSSVKAGDVVTAAPGEDRYVKLPDRTSYVAAMIEPKELEAFLEPHPGAFEEAELHRLSVLAADPATAEDNVQRLVPLLNTLAEEGPLMSDGTADFFKRNILELLTAPFRDASRYQGGRPMSSEELVCEVDRYLYAVGNRPVHISELCQHFSVHRRMLHRAFIDVLGMPPITFARRKRLGDVHWALLTGGRGTTVKGVALEHGFIELGRFADAYRRMFGELPRQTLKRSFPTTLGWFVFCLHDLPSIASTIAG
ncbi:helix-turn-helix domain-containing protein [Bradyrhizobium japonicum]|uniref:helix-turn-helix domain-containing protein n=1 Tax=Bradyrhizobium japonicum TaxID=375 RepID=UPI0027149229|nr:helix-turn-helix domain-containing protein [Bradyrhizobium japonicum]WLB66049.1 helix-turn-helix domain-containing protein [Bradyrhizobium japonicum]